MRIASLSPATTEILFALEQQKHIVCTDKFSDFPDVVRSIPHLPEHQKIASADLQMFKPDVIFTQTLVQKKLAEELRAMHLPVVHQDPRSLEEVYASIREIGIILNAEPRAHALIQTMQQSFHDTKRKAGLFHRKPRIYIEEWHHPPMVSGNWVPDIIKLAGGIPFQMMQGQQATQSDGRNIPSLEVTLSDVQTFDPDLIVLSICGAGSAASKSLLTERVGWSELRAVQAQHLFVIDDSLLNRPGPRLTEAAKRIFGWAFQALH